MAGLTVSEAGKLGGTKTKELYGVEHYKRAGKLGGKACAEKLGTEHYKRIGRIGGARLSALVAKAKKMEAAEK